MLIVPLGAVASQRAFAQPNNCPATTPTMRYVGSIPLAFYSDIVSDTNSLGERVTAGLTCVVMQNVGQGVKVNWPAARIDQPVFHYRHARGVRLIQGTSAEFDTCVFATLRNDRLLVPLLGSASEQDRARIQIETNCAVRPVQADTPVPELPNSIRRLFERIDGTFVESEEFENRHVYLFSALASAPDPREAPRVVLRLHYTLLNRAELAVRPGLFSVRLPEAYARMPLRLEGLGADTGQISLSREGVIDVTVSPQVRRQDWHMLIEQVPELPIVVLREREVPVSVFYAPLLLNSAATRPRG
jgi:hypothetical protein